MSGRAAPASPNIASGQLPAGDHPPYGIADSFVFDQVFYSLQRDLAAELTDAEYQRVRGILIQNVVRQRAGRVMEHDFAAASDAWTQYQLRVINMFQSERGRHDALHAGDVEEWQALADRLAHTAQRLLQHSGACLLYARDQAAEIAQQACEQIFAACYPWDIPFDLWANTIVRNIYLQRCTRSHDLLDRDPTISDAPEFDESYEGAAPAARTAALVSAQVYPPRDHEQGLVDASELIEAIEQMQSEQRRAVILYTYYEELSDAEIAQAIGKSRSAVHTLRHRALNQLRSLLRAHTVFMW